MSAELLIRLPDYFPSLINAMQDGFVLRGTDGTIIDVNDAFLRMTGFSRAEVVGTRPPHPWWPAEERERIERAAERYARGEPAEDDLIYQRKSGERFPVVVTSAPLHDRAGGVIGFIGTIKDMTERQRAERQLLLQAQVLDQVQAAVVVTDPSGHVTFWNRGAEGLYGWSREEANSRPIIDLIAPGSAEIVAELRERVASGDPWEGELMVRRKDGQPAAIYVSATPLRDEAGQAIGIIGVAVDISERQQAERRLAAQSAVSRGLAAAATLTAGLEAVLAGLGEHLDWQLGAFWLVDEAAREATCTVTWRASDVDAAAERCFEERRVDLTAGMLGHVWSSGTPVWIEDIATDPTFRRGTELAALGFASAVCLPVRLGHQAIGLIELFARERRAVDNAFLAQAVAIGGQVGQFIERKRAETALRESESRFRTMADSAPVLLWMAGTDALATWFNRGWLEFTGRSHEEEIGNGWTQGVYPEDLGRTLDTWLSAFAARRPFTMEYRLRRYDGEYRWLLVNGVPRYDVDGAFLGFVGSCLDITDRKRTEEDQQFLSEATSVLASSLDYRATLASVAHLAVPRVADWCAVHAIEEDGSIGQLAVAHADPEKLRWARELQERYPPDPNAPHGVFNVLRTGRPELYPSISDEVLAASARDQEHLEILRSVGFTSAMIVPIIARGRVLGAISFISAELGRHYGPEDLALAEHLAHRSAVAMDNALLYREAREAARARDQFLAVAAHELRSPLTSMKGFAQLLLRRAERSADAAEWVRGLRTIESQVNRVTELVNRLLDVSRIQEKRLQLEAREVDLVAVVRAAVTEAQVAAHEHDIRIAAAPDALPAIIDPTRVEQVLFNLLDNAVKFSPAHSSVEVRLEVAGAEAHLSVRDEGPGLPHEGRDRLFARYYQAATPSRAASEGMGLGLYVAHGIVEAHGGRMWVESEPGHGATFYVALPLHGPAPQSEEPVSG